MKNRIFLVVILMLLLSFAVSAQDFYGGLNAGILHSTKMFETKYVNDNEIEQDISTLKWGLNFGYHLNSRWRLETNIQYTNEGHKTQYNYLQLHTNPSEYASFEIIHAHQYLRIPIHAFYIITSPTAPFELGVFAGPNLGLKMKQSRKIEALNASGQELMNRVDIGVYEINKIDFGLDIGVRAQYYFRDRSGVFMDISGYHGFLNTVKQPVFPSYNNYINRNGSLSVGYQMPLF